MSNKSSEQAARDLVDSFNRNVPKGDFERAREDARRIGGEETRETERRARRSRRTVRSPTQSSSKVQSLPAEQVSSPAPNVSEPMSPAPTLQSKFQEQAQKQNQQLTEFQKAQKNNFVVDSNNKNDVIEGRLDVTFLTPAQLQVQRGRERIDRGERVGGFKGIPLVIGGFSTLLAGKIRQIPETVVNSASFVSSEFQKAVGGAKRVVEEPKVVLDESIEQAREFPKNVLDTAVATPAVVGAVAGGVVEDFSRGLKERPISTGLEIIATSVGPGVAVKFKNRLSALTAPLRKDFIPVTTVESGSRISATAEGVVVGPKTVDKVIFNVPDGSGGFSNILVKGGVASTAEDLATQTARAGTTTDAVSGQIGLVSRFDNVKSQVTGGSVTVPLRVVKTLDDTFFASPSQNDFGILRTSRMFPKETSNPFSPDVQFTFFGNRPQGIIVGKQAVKEFPSDLKPAIDKIKSVERKPRETLDSFTSRQRASLTSDEIKRLEDFQVSASKDGFTAPGFVTPESEIVTSASALQLSRGATTVIENKRVPIFTGKVVDDAIATSNKGSSTGFKSTSSTLSPDRKVFDVGQASSGLGARSSLTTPSSGDLLVQSKSSPSVSSSSDSVGSSPSASKDLSTSTPSSPIRSVNDVSNPISSPPPRRRGGRASSPPTRPSTTTSIPPTSSPPRSPPVSSPPPRKTIITSTPPLRPPVRTPPVSTPPKRPPRRDSPSQSRSAKFQLFLKPSARDPFQGTGITSSSLKDIVAKGVLKVGSTAKASFIVKDEKGKKVDAEELLRFAPSKKFTLSKSVKGALVEKPKFRISSPGELQEITFKGIKSKRRKRI